MSLGYLHPLTCCDYECAMANGCGGLGGVECSGCGKWFCPSNLDEEGFCDECAAEREEHTCADCGTYDSEQEMFDGLCFDCYCKSNPMDALRIKARELHEFAQRLRSVNLAFGTAAEGHARELDEVIEGFNAETCGKCHESDDGQ